jgi:hypothetical protein
VRAAALTQRPSWVCLQLLVSRRLAFLRPLISLQLWWGPAWPGRQGHTWAASLQGPDRFQRRRAPLRSTSARDTERFLSSFLWIRASGGHAERVTTRPHRSPLTPPLSPHGPPCSLLMGPPALSSWAPPLSPYGPPGSLLMGPPALSLWAPHSLLRGPTLSPHGPPCSLLRGP